MSESIRNTTKVKVIVRGYLPRQRNSYTYTYIKSAVRRAQRSFLRSDVKSVCIVTSSGYVLFYNSKVNPQSFVDNL